VYNLKNERFSAKDFIDDDLFGYMDAKKGKDNENVTTKRRGALEVSRAISLDPFWGDITFGSKGGAKGKTSIHSSEVHYTAYQYTIALTPEILKDPKRATLMLDAIGAVRHVGGNHARFLYDFRPESLVIRVTQDPSPWIMDSFKRMGETVGCPKLLRLVEVGDVAASELIVAGEIADTPYGEQLKKLGVKVVRGVKEAIAVAKELLKTEVAA
jgi:CRISPR-associated protein Cst2